MNAELLIANTEFLLKDFKSKTKVLEECGAGKDFLCNLKKGQTPSVDKVEKVANRFNVSVDYLLGREILNSSSDTASEVQTNIINQLLLDETSVQVAEMFQSLNISDKARVLSYIIKIKEDNQ